MTAIFTALNIFCLSLPRKMTWVHFHISQCGLIHAWRSLMSDAWCHSTTSFKNKADDTFYNLPWPVITHTKAVNEECFDYRVKMIPQKVIGSLSFFPHDQKAWEYVFEKECLVEMFLYLVFQVWKKYLLSTCPIATLVVGWMACQRSLQLMSRGTLQIQLCL